LQQINLKYGFWFYQDDEAGQAHRQRAKVQAHVKGQIHDFMIYAEGRNGEV
jgi:hypothetical protein